MDDFSLDTPAFEHLAGFTSREEGEPGGDSRADLSFAEDNRSVL